MDKKYILLCFLYVLFSIQYSSAQTASVSADPLTGAGSVMIPLYGVNSGGVSVPVNLVYSGRGIKPNDVEGTAGIGWNVSAGGSISRVVRGLPDDILKDNAGKSKYGWMSTLNNTPGKIDSFAIANNGTTCSYETTDLAYISAHFPYTYDTEPDIYYVNAPGLSCQLVYNRDSSKFMPLSYQDIVINYTTVGGSGNNPNLINSFTITNDKGIKYLFSVPESVTERTTLGSKGVAAYMTTKYYQYINGMSYVDAWELTSITDVNGNYVSLTYTTESQTNGTDSVAFYLPGAPAYSLQYRITTSVIPERLGSIICGNVNGYYTALSFTWVVLSSTGQSVISGITGSGRNYMFNYSLVAYVPTGFSRCFLRSFSDAGVNCASPVNYQFAYLGESSGGSVTSLPDSTSTLRDYWGYYSTGASSSTLIPSVYVNPYSGSYPRYLIEVSASPGSIYAYTLSNSNRGADPTNVATGSLSKITYAMGGNTNIFYESNDYYDTPSSSVVKGGGIRVKKIIDSVGNGSTNNIIRTFSYIDTLTGTSSGKPISLPQYAFVLPYSGSATGHALWTDITALAAYDLSPEDHTIMYTATRERQTGAGSTTYSYYVPAGYYDIWATPGCSGCSTADWYPTVNNIGRTNCASTYGPISNYTYSYPFIPNPNYDFERGLLLKVGHYNDAGAEVSESDYTYQRSYSPSAVLGFKFDTIRNGMLSVIAYNKDTIFCHTSELTYTAISKVFDSQSLSVARIDTATYTYGSTAHKLVTKIQANNSDNSTLTTSIKYAKDYSVASGTNPNVTAIYTMHQQNINAPIESYNQVTRAGTATTTQAALALFRDTTIGGSTLVVPSQQYKWVQPNGGTFTPMSISGQTLTKDAGYFCTANYDIYDNTGFAQTVDDNYKHIGTTIINHFANQPIAVFSNAAYNQVAYSDFDSDLTSPGYAFSISGSEAFTPTSGHAGNAYGLGTTQTISKTVTKNTIASNYIFSIWINATAAGTLTVTLNTTPYTISFAGNGKWTYYELNKLSLSGMPSSLPVTATSNQQIAIDDILFYPDVAEVSTSTYDPTTHWRLDATNTNGISSYFAYDHWARPTYVYDQDMNIVKKNTYLTPADIATYSSPTISAPNPVHGLAVVFTTGASINACAAAGVNVTWNFGDGTIIPKSGLTSPSHTYAGSIGTNYTVSATINSPLLGTVTPGPVTVTVQPNTVHLSYTTYTTSHGDVSSVAFYDSTNTTLLYSFTGSQLNTATVPQGVYVIHESLSDGQQYNSGTGAGYNSVSLTGSCYSSCANYVIHNNYQFSADLSNCTSLAFTVSQYVCP